jgi:uncharacterized protein with HEPN domain
MLDAARLAVRSAKGRRRDELDDEEDLFVHGLVRLVGVIGEAASKVSKPTRAEIDYIPWADIIGMRMRLVHDYFDIDLDIVWATVQTSLPDLIGKLERSLPPDERA